ncbi:MAG TPA: PAS domain-containing sensor histidine kinase, partial [Candidatus Paceibacterota bacterium]|nr:PAS domain-containing sensor histidine kinase [Candidatus Paceibacterota bacterium]
VGAFIVVVMVMVYEFATMRERATHLALHLAKDRVQYSHDIFSILFRNSSVPFIVVDEHGVIESTNPSAARLFHVELDSLDGLEVFHFIAAEDETKTALIPEYFTHGKIVNDVEVVLHRPDGVDRYVLLSVFSFKDAKGKGKGLVTLIDVTKQKMVDKAKTEFVSLASHQLRTPISGMKWNIELLLTAGRENLTPAQSGYVDKIAHGLERMDMLVGDFLSVSKFELGTLSAQYTSFSAAQFLRTIYDEHDPLAKKKNVSLEPNLGKADGTISCDSHLLHMIVSNLVSNAVKYTPEGGRVKFDAVLDPAHLTVTVADTGMGIPASEQDMLFSKLFRASNAKTQVTDGTGLGLYIVREAVKILKGDISFVSTEGVGTTFTVVLPK